MKERKKEQNIKLCLIINLHIRLIISQPQPYGTGQVPMHTGAQPGVPYTNTQGAPYHQPQPQPQQHYPAQGYPQQGYPQPYTGPGSAAAHPEHQAAPNVNNQCPAAFMRMTINAIPATQNLLTKSSIPLGCTIHPLRTNVKDEVS